MGLKIQLLGVVRVSHNRIPIETKLCRAASGLLAYLVLFRDRTHARDVLSGIFWGEYSDERARSSLSTTLWRLRKVLEPSGVPRGTYLLTPSVGEIGFNPESKHWLDVDVLETQARQILSKPCNMLSAGEVCELENALKLYTGELLEGFYDDWALSERERIRSLYLKGQATLLCHYQNTGAYDQALACGQRILYLDPLREEIHREMMRLYVKNGQRAQALRQYEKCHKILAAELDIPPMEETRALRAEIARNASPHRLSYQSHLDRGDARLALEQLRSTLQDFDKAIKQLRRTADVIEGIIKPKSPSD
jgi:DNA-binding SARP family transcriptional activator